MEPTARRQVTRVDRDTRRTGEDHLVGEAPFELRIGDTPIAVLMRTPGDEEDLVRGFAITEGIILNPAEIAGIGAVPGDTQGDRWRLELLDGVTVDPERFRRNLYTSSSCGVCGKASIDAVRITAPPPPQGPSVGSDVLFALPDKMHTGQSAFAITGGLHAAAAFSPGGDLLAIREDVGRHNAVDKLVGSLAAATWPLPEMILLVSGRVSFEMVQKAAVAGISVVCGVSAASSLAVELGEELGLTVVGFLRDESCNIYTNSHRIT